MPCRATQDGWVIVESSDKTCSTGERNGKPLQYSCLENLMNSRKRQNDRILKEELPRSVGAQYATGDQWRNNPRKSEEMESKQKQHPAVDMIGDVSKSNSFKSNIASVQFSSVAQSCLTLCDPMKRSTPGLPVHHHLPEFTQTHVYQVGDAIQPSHPLSSPTPPSLNLSQHQGLFK